MPKRDRDRMLAGKGATAGQALIGHHPQGVQVAGRCRRLAGGLLRRQVAGRAHQQLPLITLALTERPRDAKVGHLHRAVWADKQVGWLDVPVHQPGPVGRPNRQRRLSDNVEAPVQPQASLPSQQRRQRLPVTNSMTRKAVGSAQQLS
jgi:hypothetical protein